jgi:hypothetical protein
MNITSHLIEQPYWTSYDALRLGDTARFFERLSFERTVGPWHDVITTLWEYPGSAPTPLPSLHIPRRVSWLELHLRHIAHVGWASRKAADAARRIT